MDLLKEVLTRLVNQHTASSELLLWLGREVLAKPEEAGRLLRLDRQNRHRAGEPGQRSQAHRAPERRRDAPHAIDGRQGSVDVVRSGPSRHRALGT